MSQRLRPAAGAAVILGLFLLWLALRPNARSLPVTNTPVAAATAGTPIPTNTPSPINTATATPPPSPTAPSTSTPTATSNPLFPVPTATTSAPATTVAPTTSPTNTATGAATASATSAATTYPSLPLTTVLTPIPDRARFGSAGGRPDMIDALAEGLNLGSYFDWAAYADPLLPPSIDFWQMIRVNEQGFNFSFDDLVPIIQAQPGAIWIIGNEPDVVVQDNTTPETYAIRYHEAYTFIKATDPTAQIAIAGVAQPTPLRLAYLDRVLNHYHATYGQPMPIDIWTMHAFILREEAGSWGAGIPPGLDASSGMLYEIADHDNLDIWRDNLLNFRRWLAARGYGNRPLAITEYGILMPTDYGFPPQNVIAFLENTVDWMWNATDPAGYPPENGRLIQWWFWFSVYDPGFPTSDLFDPDSGRLTPLGEAYAALVNANS